MTTDDPLRAALTEALAEEAQSLSVEKEPSEEELLAYLENELPEEEERRLQDRLAASPRAASRLLQLEALVQAGPPTTGEGKAEVAAGLAELRARLPVAAAPRRPAQRLFPGWRPAWCPVWSWAAAVSLAVIGLGLTLWLGLRGPGPPEVVANVRPPEAPAVLRGEPGDGAATTLGPGPVVQLLPGAPQPGVVAATDPAAGPWLYVELVTGQRGEACTVSVSRGEGPARRAEGLRPMASKVFLALRTRAGSHQIRLRCGGAGEEIYRLEVTRPEGR